MSLRIGIDIGGTFTDLVAIAADGDVTTHKTASTPHDYGEGIIAGLARAAGRPARRRSADVLHATTVGSNTVLEGKGARTALITTRGFRDILEIRDLRMPVLYDIGWTKPRALVERRLRLEVTEKMRPDGSVAVPLDPASLEPRHRACCAPRTSPASRSACCTAMPTRRTNRRSPRPSAMHCRTSRFPSAAKSCRRSRNIRAPARPSSTPTSSRSCAPTSPRWTPACAAWGSRRRCN